MLINQRGAHNIIRFGDFGSATDTEQARKTKGLPNHGMHRIADKSGSRVALDIVMTDEMGGEIVTCGS